MYLEFQRVERELENLTNMYLAYQFISAKKLMQHSLEELENKTQEIERIKKKIDEHKTRAVEIEKEVAEHQKKDSV